MKEQEDIFIDEQNPDGSPASGEKPGPSRRTRLIIGVCAAIFICILGLAIPLLLNTSEPPALTVTVFSNDWSEVVLKTGVETPLNEYLASDSSVPGFPLRVSASNSDDITLSVDAGSLFTWGKPEYVAENRGMEYSVNDNDTVYWSPYNDSSPLVPQCTLTVTAKAGGSDAAQLRFIIRQTSETAYSITLLAGE
jgi:hypothetical protein